MAGKVRLSLAGFLSLPELGYLGGTLHPLLQPHATLALGYGDAWLLIRSAPKPQLRQQAFRPFL